MRWVGGEGRNLSAKSQSSDRRLCSSPSRPRCVPVGLSVLGCASIRVPDAIKGLASSRSRADMIAIGSGLAMNLRDGTSITVRPIVPEDKQLLVDVFGRLSEESRFWRFFMNLRGLTPAMLANFTEVDHSNHEAVIAIESSSGQAVGVARYGRSSEDPEAAEVAVAVIDAWHRRGVARVLLAELSARARHEGFRRFVAVVRADNRAAVALFERAGGGKPRVAGSVLEYVIELGQGSVRSCTPR